VDPNVPETPGKLTKSRCQSWPNCNPPEPNRSKEPAASATSGFEMPFSDDDRRPVVTPWRSGRTLLREDSPHCVRASLVSKAVLGTAAGALPGDIVAGHAPQVLMHARLTDQKAATATPAEGGFSRATVADLRPFSASPGGARWSAGRVVHRLSSTGREMAFRAEQASSPWRVA